MIDDVTVARVHELRTRGLTPKLIARKLSLPLREVSQMVTSLAVQRGRSTDVVGCWINPDWGAGLSIPADRGWSRSGTQSDPQIVTVLVARERRHDTVSCCVYLVDPYCLGVKNAVGPKEVSRRDLNAFRDRAFGGYDGLDPVPAPLDLAQELIFGAVDYALSLGFDPHPDFAAAADQLGDWTRPSVIGFGFKGKPFYQQGPYDNPRAIMRALDRAVGPGGYDFTVDARSLDPEVFAGATLPTGVREVLATSR